MTPTNQRRNPVKRAFSGLVGLPPEPETTPATPGAVEPTETLVLPDTQILLTMQNVENREKRAKAARERRKRKAEQLAAIKKALQTPIAEITKAAEERRRIVEEQAAAERLPLMSAGKFATGGGEVVPVKDIEAVDAALQRGETLRNPNIDPEEEEQSAYADDDRRNVRPEGSGPTETNPDDEREDEEENTKDAKDNKVDGKDADILPGAKFPVKLNDFDYDEMFQNLFNTYFIKVVPPGCDIKSKECFYFCRLCEISLDWERTSKTHIEMVHGDEREPTHDPRFGNVVKEYTKSKRKRSSPKNAVTA
jgi:hypothetical protein